MFRRAVIYASLMATGYLSPLHPKAQLAAPVDCVAQSDPGTGLHLDRGDWVEELDWIRPPQGGSYFLVNVLSGTNKGWSCQIDSTGHLPVTMGKQHE